jgi:uncharacterized Tic20 family protein
MTESTPNADSRQNAALANILGVITGFVAPLIFFVVKKDDVFVRNHSREALNFQITVGALHIANSIMVQAVPFWVLLSWIPSIGLFIISLVWSIQGLQAANAGRAYRYPVAVRLVS